MKKHKFLMSFLGLLLSFFLVGLSGATLHHYQYHDDSVAQEQESAPSDVNPEFHHVFLPTLGIVTGSVFLLVCGTCVVLQHKKATQKEE